MRSKITAHARGRVAGNVALCAALAGTSYAALSLKPESALARFQLARQSVDDSGTGATGGVAVQPTVPPGASANGDVAVQPTDPAATVGTGSIGARARLASSVVAKNGGSTDVPLSGNSWTQPADELQLLAGTVVMRTPNSCTGSFGNALTLEVDGKAMTFAPAATAPGLGATTLTMPFVIGTLSEPGKDTPHKLTAKFANSCTKGGEDFTVQDVKVDVLKFR